MRPHLTAPPRHLAAFFLVAFASLAIALGYWTFPARDSLLARIDNPRALIAYNRIQRGRILDRNGLPLAETVGQPGAYTRRYEPSAALVVGYASFTYGLSGIEAAADSILTGVEDLESIARSWHYDVLNEPQIGHDAQLTLDLNLQRAAYNALDGRAGAIVILDTRTGDLLAMASTPSFDPAKLEEDFETFTEDSNGPLVNRATLALYRADDFLALFPRTLDLSYTPSLPIPVRPAEGNRLTPLHLALLAAAVAEAGLMPAPRLIISTASTRNGAGNQIPSHPIAMFPPAAAADLLPQFQAGLLATIPSGFEDETLGWYVEVDSQRALCVVLENSAGAEAQAIAQSVRQAP